MLIIVVILGSITLAIESVNQLNNRQILQQVSQTAKQGVDTQEYLVNQTQIILNNQTANTHRIENISNQGKNIMDNQVVLVRTLGNATDRLNNQSSEINQNAKVLVLQSTNIDKTLDFIKQDFNKSSQLFNESERFNQQWERDDRLRSSNILDNITEIHKALRAFTLSPPSSEESGSISGLDANRSATVLP
jgi:ABC-type transporter Mla subunit MlaD